MERYLIIVSRDRPELLETFKRTLASGDGGADILLDRRTQHFAVWRGPGPDRRSSVSLNRDLETKGFMVVKQP